MSETLDPNALMQRIAALTPAGKALLHQWLESVGESFDSRQGSLTACISTRDEVSTQALREHLLLSVPDYMVPPRIVTLAQLPRTAAGKIDRRAIQILCDQDSPPAPAHGCDDRTPRTEMEMQLARIWAEVLDFDDIDVHDNFFEVGGDSLLSIRILSRASKAGIAISAEDFFAHPTVAAQAAVASTAAPAAVRRKSRTGALPLLPIQHWFFSRITKEPQHWNQSLLFALRHPVDVATLDRAVNKLLAQHDALRCAFDYKDGHWSARIDPPGSYAVVEMLDVSALSASVRTQSITAFADTLNTDLQLHSVPLLRVGLIRTPADEPDQLLVVAHHLIVDAQSWSIVMDDLQTLCQQLRKGEPPRLNAPAAGVADWAEQLATLANSAALAPMAKWWAQTLSVPILSLPMLSPAAAQDNVEAQRRTVNVKLDHATTAALLDIVPGALRISVNEALVSALGRALAPVGRGHITFDMEGHGREALFDDLDIARCVGWFTTVFPVCLPDAADPSWTDAQAAVRNAKQALRALPLNGLSHGLVVHNRDADPAADAVRQAARAPLLFNYLGKESRGTDADLFQLIDERCGQARSPACPRAYWIEVNTSVRKECLVAEWSYADRAIPAATVAAMAEAFVTALVDLTAAVHASDSTSVTPEDFPLAGLDQQELDDLSDLLDDMDS